MSYTRPQRPMGPAEHDELFLVEAKIDSLLLLFNITETEVSSSTIRELEKLRDDIHGKRRRYQQRLLSKWNSQ